MSDFVSLPDPENSGLEALKEFLQDSLVQYGFDKSFRPDDIIAIATMQRGEQACPGSVVEIQLAWLKTTSLEIIQALDRERVENKRKFNAVAQVLFDHTNPSAHPFLASQAQKLRQFRLSGTYEVREIVTEAYLRGIKQIDSGTFIEIPLAWLRGTCLNIIRDLRRKQDRAERPRIDQTPWEPGDVVFSKLMLKEDLRSIEIAAENLTPEEKQLLYNRICKGLSWQQISELTSTSEQPLSPGTARQRGHRALKKLRQCYDSIRDTVKITDDSADDGSAPNSGAAWETSNQRSDWQI